MLKIALLFLTIADIYHEDYWKDFLRGHESRYSIYVHAKNELSPTSFFKPFELAIKVPTSWENTMKAQVTLLKEALKNPENQKFIFISESTIPLQNFDTVYKKVMSTPKSIFAYKPNPHQYAQDVLYATRSLDRIPQEFRYKNSQWVVLNRKHAELMTQDTVYLDIISQYEADNELYPASFLASQGKLNEIMPRDTTYVNWERQNPPSAGRPYPFIFSHLDDASELACIINAIRNNFLFARKFAASAKISLLDFYLSYRKQATKN